MRHAVDDNGDGARVVVEMLLEQRMLAIRERDRLAACRHANGESRVAGHQDWDVDDHALGSDRWNGRVPYDPCVRHGEAHETGDSVDVARTDESGGDVLRGKLAVVSETRPEGFQCRIARMVQGTGHDGAVPRVGTPRLRRQESQPCCRHHLCDYRREVGDLVLAAHQRSATRTGHGSPATRNPRFPAVESETCRDRAETRYRRQYDA